MKLLLNIIAGILIIQFIACKTNIEEPIIDPDENPTLLDWLIPQSAIIIRTTKSDEIEALTQPVFVNTSIVNYLDDSDLVSGIYLDGEFRVYPHKILRHHEVVNDVIKNQKVTFTFCPLTGTSAAWDTENLQGIKTNFGVSKFIYNSNHLLYDKETHSYWLQMYSQCVAGAFEGYRLEKYGIVETSWANWKFMFPGAKVMNIPTVTGINYGINPYEGFEDSDTLHFFTSPIDNRLPLKERVHALIVNKRAKAYRFNSFTEPLFIIEDNFQGLSVVIIGSIDRNFIVSYQKRLASGTELDFTVNTDAQNIIMTDNEGSKWDIFGLAVDGPRKGQQLLPTESIMSYWYAIGAMYPDALIYE